MIEFRLNLIRNQVPDAARRRQRYRAMLVYLGLTGVALVGAMGLASSRLVQAAALREQSAHLERLYARDHEGQGGLIAGSDRLHQRLQALGQSLQAVDRQLAADTRPARLVRSLLVNLPPGITLRTFKLSREDHTVLIELLVAGGYDGRVSATDLAGLWQKDPEVMAYLQDVSFQGSQIENVAGRSDNLWRFIGHFQGGGS